MPHPTLIPFKAEHLSLVVNRDTTEQEPWALAQIKQDSGPALTGLYGEIILGCAGLILPWPGMGVAWMVLSEQIGGHGLWMTRMVRRFLDDASRNFHLHRVEALALADNTRNQHWIERLGFTRENGKARQYTPGRQDMIRYERVKED